MSRQAGRQGRLDEVIPGTKKVVSRAAADVGGYAAIKDASGSDDVQKMGRWKSL